MWAEDGARRAPRTGMLHVFAQYRDPRVLAVLVDQARDEGRRHAAAPRRGGERINIGRICRDLAAPQCGGISHGRVVS